MEIFRNTENRILLFRFLFSKKAISSEEIRYLLQNYIKYLNELQIRQKTLWFCKIFINKRYYLFSKKRIINNYNADNQAIISFEKSLRKRN